MCLHSSPPPPLHRLPAPPHSREVDVRGIRGRAVWGGVITEQRADLFLLQPGSWRSSARNAEIKMLPGTWSLCTVSLRRLVSQCSLAFITGGWTCGFDFTAVTRLPSQPFNLLIWQTFILSLLIENNVWQQLWGVSVWSTGNRTGSTSLQVHRPLLYKLSYSQNETWLCPQACQSLFSSWFIHIICHSAQQASGYCNDCRGGRQNNNVYIKYLPLWILYILILYVEFYKPIL